MRTPVLPNRMPTLRATFSKAVVPWWSVSTNWDSLDDYERRRVKEELERKLHFLRWAKIVLYLRVGKTRSASPAQRSQRCPYRCVYEALYTEADTRFDRSHDSSAAAESRRRTSEDEICTPGRSESLPLSWFTETRFRMFRKATVDIWKAGSEINSNSRAHRSESNLERTRIPTPKRPNRRIPAECGNFYKEPRLKDAARSVPQISINNDLS